MASSFYVKTNIKIEYYYINSIMIRITSVYGNDIITTNNIIIVNDLKNEFLKKYSNICFDNLIISTHGIILNNQENLYYNYRYNIIIRPIICNNH